jgi:hypothetical protein
MTIDLVIGTQIRAEPRRQFSDLGEDVALAFEKLDDLRKAQPKRVTPLAGYSYRSLRSASGFRLQTLLSRIAICNIDYFDSLLSEFNNVVEQRISRIALLEPVGGGA